jgi:hypothetical protein
MVRPLFEPGTSPVQVKVKHQSVGTPKCKPTASLTNGFHARISFLRFTVLLKFSFFSLLSFSAIFLKRSYVLCIPAHYESKVNWCVDGMNSGLPTSCRVYYEIFLIPFRLSYLVDKHNNVDSHILCAISCRTYQRG